ncbi:VRR-NUC domain-containing protein [Kushneria phosphatilytica]|uniref:VRR-NUC domain-containing protein n=1 Tax=Kushneria phosphatilytica TaxID=657387 RepID=A0A1S1NYM4_9GAMM|nr:VRR-NUC domain-containing protein [Kushneria phosphatilytica]OHV12987.1 VRR-NUC domain-containing protein [Kushneria phosphatilytica]QEL10857.1 VRR-NUC domain-containing protein [Kushneria phosphatilytica]
MSVPAKTPTRKPSRRAPKRQRVDWEGQEQAVLIRWLYGERQRQSIVGPAYAATYAVPNGGSRHKLEAANMKKQGVRAGVSDLVIAVPRGGYHGLYLEFKATPPRDAALADSQREWLTLAEEQGYCSVLARGLEEAKATIREYMSRPATRVLGKREPLKVGSDWR